MHRPQAGADEVRAENLRRYELLAETAAHYAAQGDTEHVLRAAMLAAHYAWMAPTGRLGDVRLERTVVDAVRGSGTVATDGARHAGRVLHVLSEAYAIGGHTRLVWRWMSRDERAGDVVLTNQQGPVPDLLVEAAQASGGQLVDLRSTAVGFLDRARALRRHMDRADLVVFHVHPYDSIALAAANLPGVRPPIVYENHTDQSFWLGLGAADVLCDLRPQARPLDLALRRVPAERIGVLPMPVDELASAEGASTRRALGIRPDAVVALTVSADWKMAPCWGRGMHSAVERVLHWSPQVSVVLVGARSTPDWARLAKRFPGRIHLVGNVADPAPYFAAADVYLDSYPLRSTTAALEAAVLGLPVVSLEDLPEDDPASLLQASSPGLTGRLVTGTYEKFALAVRRLAADPQRRSKEGRQIRAGVLAVHDGDAWRAGLEALYAQARSVPAADVDAMPDCPVDERFGAMMVSTVIPVTSPDPQLLLGPLGEQFDGVLRAGVFAVFQRGSGSLSVRVAAGWEDHREWTSRLVALAGARPRLRVSMPFVADDDVAGSRTTTLLEELIADLGSTPEDCGDVNVESGRPTGVVSVGGELPFTTEALDWLTELVGSPCWEPLPARAPAAELAGATA